MPALTESSTQLLTLPELYLLPYTGELGNQVYRSAAEAAIGDINAKHALDDLQTYCKVAASDTGVLFDCTTPASLFYPINMCYQPETGMPRTMEQLFPTLSVELAARGRPLTVSLAPTVLGEGFSGRATYGTYGPTNSGSSGSSNKMWIVAVVLFVLVVLIVLGVMGWRTFKMNRGPAVSGAAAWGIPDHVSRTGADSRRASSLYDDNINSVTDVGDDYSEEEM